MRPARNVVTRRVVALLPKTGAPIEGENVTATIAPAIARREAARRVVLTTAPAVSGCPLPRLLDMYRVAVAGRASWVTVLKMARSRPARILGLSRHASEALLV